MNRRGFFSRLVGAALAPAMAKLVPESTDSNSDLILSMDDFEDCYIRPSLAVMANQWDREILEEYGPRSWWARQPKLNPERLPA